MSSVMPKQGRSITARELSGEIVAFDTATKEAHRLSGLAAKVWSRCDGVSSRHNVAHEVGCTTDELSAALAALDERGLVNAYTSRRTVMRGAIIGGAAVAALPFIETITAPLAAAAASTGSPPPVEDPGGSDSTSTPPPGTVDYTTYPANLSSYWGIGYGTAHAIYFPITRTGSLTGFKLCVSGVSGNDPLIVTLATGTPTSIDATRRSIAVPQSDLQTSDSTSGVYATFNSPLAVTAGQSYWLALTCPGSSGDYWQMTNSSATGTGAESGDDGASWPFFGELHLPAVQSYVL